MVHKETEEMFVRGFRDYLENNYSHLSKSTLNSYFNDSMSRITLDRGYDFWLAISNKDILEKFIDTNNKSWSLWSDIYSDSATAINGGNANLGTLKMYEYLDEKADFKNRIISETKKYSEEVVNTIVNDYVDSSSRELIKDKLSSITGHDPDYFDKYVNDYEFLLGYRDDVYRMNADTLYYFLDKFDDEKLDKVIERLNLYSQISYVEHQNIFPYRYDELTSYVNKRGSKAKVISDVENMFEVNNKLNLEECFWIIHTPQNDYNLDQDYINKDTWENKVDKFANRLNNIPVGANFALVEDIDINDEYSKFFDKGLLVLAKGKLIDNPKDGINIKIKWEKEVSPKIWYRDQFTSDLALVNAERSWAKRNFVNFLLGREEQDIDRYIKSYGKKTSKAILVEESINLLSEEDVTLKDNSYTLTNFLEEVFIDESEYHKISNLLSIKQNIILQGAPGVGKTFMAKRLAYSRLGLIDNKFVKQIQFHQSYSYEDLIAGYRPTETGFEIKTGPFYDFCQTAIENPDEEYYFIIDEINRGNISKIFGELLMLIESDKRGPSNAIKLMYLDEEFYVPENLYIIGLMNTADRSLAVLDYALRRRFAFYTLTPAFSNKRFREMLNYVENEKMINLVKEIENINRDIVEDDSLGFGFEIGHSYFTYDRKLSDLHVSNIIDYEIIPLIEEYWYDNQSLVKHYSIKLRDVVDE